MDCFTCLLLFLTTCSGFQVSVPAGRVVAVRDQPVVLGCLFTPDDDPSSLVVTWQLVTSSRVVHSFYHQHDQPDVQDPHYRSRTSLFNSELHKGNASLRIEPVESGDVGEYLCTVGNSKGTDKARVQLEYGAFYTEPSLRINVSCSGVTLLYESEGFPKPEVSWLGENGEVLTDHTELSEDAGGAGGAVGLYHLKSSHVSSSSSLKVIFSLRNRLLDQVLLRPVSITYGGENQSCGVKNTAVIVLSVLCVLLISCITVLLIKMKRRAGRRAPVFENGKASRENGNETLPCAEAFIPLSNR